MSLNDMLLGTAEKLEDKRINVKDILQLIFDKKGIEQQTILSNENINAIIKMNALNKYLNTHHNFELEIFTGLINDKRLNIISYNGRGRKDIIEAIQAMQDQHIEIPEKKTFL